MPLFLFFWLIIFLLDFENVKSYARFKKNSLSRESVSVFVPKRIK